jgi:hypothetical protein
MEAPAKAQRLMGVAHGMLGFGVFVMTRRHMLGVKDRAEGRYGAARRSFPIHPGGREDVAPEHEVKSAPEVVPAGA